MTTIADLVTAYTRVPIASVLLDGKPWRSILRLRTNAAFGSGIASGTVEGREPPVTPEIGMTISWRWGYAGASPLPGFSGEISDITDTSYPDRWSLECRDMLWRADKSSQVIATDPLNEITAKDATLYILATYGAIRRMSIPDLEASGSAWGGSSWTLGVLTPVQWGDSDTESGGTTALKAAQEICSCLGYWLYADAAGVVRAKQMERKPSSVAMRTFERGVSLLLEGAPERRQSYDSISNQVTVRGANTGVAGVQILDQYQTEHPLLPDGVYRNFDFSSFLIEYVNEAEAGAASATAIAKRILRVLSRAPDVITARIKADPRIAVGTTIGITDEGVGLESVRRFFVYGLETTLDLQSGAFDQRLTLDGGVGNAGYTTIPPPDAGFSWRLMTETLDGTAVVEVFLDGSGSISFNGEIVSWAWSTATATYGSTPDTATGVNAVFIFPASAGTAEVTLTVVDTTSKQGTLTQTIDLTGAADALPAIARVVSAAAGAAWYVTPDGGATWNIETSAGDAVAVPPCGAGGDVGSIGTAATYGLLATRGSGGVGVRQTLDALATASTPLASIGTAIQCMWANESNPARVWVGAGDTVYRSLDGGATFTAMAKPAVGVDVSWIIEDPSVDDSVFAAVGADLYHATAPTVGWVVLYAGPVGATARQFVRSKDGQVTWVCYIGTFTGDAAQRVETGAGADIAASTIRTLALDRQASGALATLYLVDGANPAAIYVCDGLTGLSAVTSSQTFPTGAIVQHILADPDVDVIYAADFSSIAAGRGALRKYFPGPDVLLLWKALAVGQQGHMLGIGDAAPVVNVRFVVATYRLSDPTLDGFWLYDQGVYTLKAPPQTGWAWLAVAAHPFDPNRWLAFGMTGTEYDTFTYTAHLELSGTATLRTSGVSPLWLTDDLGETWQEVILPGTGFDPYGGVRAIGWQEQNGHWYALGVTVDSGGSIHTACFWTGIGATDGVLRRPTAPLYQDIVWGTSGMDGEYLASGDDSPGLGTAGRLAHIADDGNLFQGEAWATNVGGYNQPRGPLDTIRNTPIFWQINTRSGAPGICYWTDYHITDSASVTGIPYTRPNDVAGAYQYVAVGEEHVYFTSNVGGSIGIYRREHATWTPSGAPDYPVKGLVYGCATDRQSRRLFIAYAAISSVYQFIVHDGSAFAVVPLPDPDIGTALAGAGGIYKDQFGVPYAALGEVVP